MLTLFLFYDKNYMKPHTLIYSVVMEGDMGSEKSTFIMNPIPADKKRGWTVLVDGEEVQVGKVELLSKFGTLTYGLRPEGYDAWVFAEAGSGGVVIVPYCFHHEDGLLVGLLRETRANMGTEPVFCAAGGFVEKNEAHHEAQAREMDEETGMDSSKAHQLPGAAINSNRAFFVADAKKGEGARAYAFELSEDALEALPDGGFKLRDPDSLPNLNKGKDVVFFYWKDAIEVTPCAMARSAIAQLLTVLL